MYIFFIIKNVVKADENIEPMILTRTETPKSEMMVFCGTVEDWDGRSLCDLQVILFLSRLLSLFR